MKTDTLRVYDIGTNVRRYDVESLQAFAWPVAAWTCVVPDTIDPTGLNILVKLILSLVDKGVFTERSAIAAFLKNELHINQDLVDNVLDDCEAQYFNKNFKKNIHLKDDATKMLRSSEGDISFSDNVSTTSHRIYLLQDCVTKAVVPYFDLKELPKEYESISDTNDYIKPNCEFEINRQPKTATISNALKLWSKILRNISEDDFEDASISTSEIENMEENSSLVEESEDEVDESITSITILSDKPEYLCVRGYLRFDYDYPEELLVHSPFGLEYDTWFEKILRQTLITDDKLKKEFDFLIQLKKDYFKDKIVFGSDREIGLFNEFPAFFNDEKNKAVKDEVKNLYRAFEEYKHDRGRDEVFKRSLRFATDKFLKIIKEDNRYLIDDTFVHDAEDLKSDIQSLTSIIGIELDYQDCKRINNIMGNYKSNALDDGGNIKDILARMLVYAYRNQGSKIFECFYRCHEYFKLMVIFSNFGNTASHSIKHQDALTIDVVNKYFRGYIHIFEILYKCFY